MCGFTGIVCFDGRPLAEAMLARSSDRLEHRGPDGRGLFLHTPKPGAAPVSLALLHHRLAIIDPADGAQPMIAHTPDGPVAVAFNGCIYNHRTLRRTLESRGCRFATDHSDTETILQGYLEFGTDIAARLDGMFAIAIFDSRTGAIHLIRDRAGEKPLYLWTGSAGPSPSAVFASTIPALLEAVTALRGTPPDPSPKPWWASMLRRGVCVNGDLPWSDLTQVAPATLITLGPNAPTQSSTFAAPAQRTGPAPTVEAFESMLEASVGERLDADVPLGCFLSGGIDSALVAFFAQHLLRQQGRTLQTFTMAMPDPAWDESAAAAETAAFLDTQHTTLTVEPKPVDDLARLIGRLGLPFGDSSILPTCWIAREARQSVKVVLTGDGGDELFLGYDRYRVADLLARRRRLLAMIPASIGVRAGEKSLRSRAARLAQASRHAGYLDLVSTFPTWELARLCPEAAAAEPPTPTGLAEAVADDLAIYLPDDLLRKVDTATMAVALESRAPLLAGPIMDAALRAPLDSLMIDSQPKGFLRQVAARLLPRDVALRPKSGFALPLGEWFRSDYGGLTTAFRDGLASADPFGPVPVRAAAAQRLLDEHTAKRSDHGQRLFTLLSLMQWRQAFA